MCVQKKDACGSALEMPKFTAANLSIMGEEVFGKDDLLSERRLLKSRCRRQGIQPLYSNSEGTFSFALCRIADFAGASTWDAPPGQEIGLPGEV